jgi:SAM-dependent methyltransferase
MTTTEAVREHFAARAPSYDRSSAWCTDEELGRRLLDLAAPASGDQVLDVACGTGLVSRLFAGRVRRLVGVDITPDMAEQARGYLDELVIAPAESMPFDSDAFDIVVSRQGIQFMALPEALVEMVRVARPGGRVIVINAAAYGPGDRDEYFEILRLRNPVRRQFFVPEDLERLLRAAGCERVAIERHISAEDVDTWSDNGAIDEGRREAIREVYRNASPEFRRLHAVQETDGRIVDHMLFVIASGCKPA